MVDPKEMAEANRRKFLQELNIQQTTNVQKGYGMSDKAGTCWLPQEILPWIKYKPPEQNAIFADQEGFSLFY